MQEEVTNKVIALVITADKLTAEILQKAIRTYLNYRKEQKNKPPKIYKGKQTIKQLMNQNAGVSNIEISDTLLTLINASEAREDDVNFKNPVDILFDRLEESDPDHFAVKQYKKYKLAAGKTAKSIPISCGARLAPFDIKELHDLTDWNSIC